MGDKTPDGRTRTYAEIMREQALQREMANTLQNIKDKQRAEQEAAAAAGEAGASGSGVGAAGAAPPAAGQKRRNRWDSTEDADA
jgi:splicing factor 3B subunit 1